MDVVVHCACFDGHVGDYEAYYKANGGYRECDCCLPVCRCATIGEFVYPSIYFDFRDRLNIAEDFAGSFC